MRELKAGQKVRVTDGPDAGKTGTVRRLRLQDGGAWVELDGAPSQRSFFSNSPNANDVLLYPEQCDEDKP